jgi:hypothetical protein
MYHKRHQVSFNFVKFLFFFVNRPEKNFGFFCLSIMSNLTWVKCSYVFSVYCLRAILLLIFFFLCICQFCCTQREMIESIEKWEKYYQVVNIMNIIKLFFFNFFIVLLQCEDVSNLD